MPSRLTLAHIEGEARLRSAVTGALARVWHALPNYRDENIDQWLSTAVPIVEAGHRQSARLTDAYIARQLGRQPFGVDLDSLTLRRGATTAEAYARPFVTVWTALGNGKQLHEAVNAGLARAQGMAAFDVQAAMRDTAQQIGSADEQIQRFQRVADGGACDFCQEVDGAILNSDDAMPLHNHCGCGIEPLTEERPVTPTPDAVAVNQDGEKGPMLGDPTDSFTKL